MPTASTEKMGNAEAQPPKPVGPPMSQAIEIVEKKARNLKKRKAKLEILRDKEERGLELEGHERTSYKQYDEVSNGIEFCAELQRQFEKILKEEAKQLRIKRGKDEEMWHTRKIQRVQDLLKVQNVLDSMGPASVRADFQTGKHGAVVLTEENLKHLDQLYQLISPSREGEGTYEERLTQAAKHIAYLLEGKKKSIFGTTFKELRELVELINKCGYFEKVRELEKEKDAESKEAVADATLSTTETAVEDVAEKRAEIVADLVVVQTAKEDSASRSPQQDFTSDPRTLKPTEPPMKSGVFTESDVYQPAVARPIDEIVSSVQGSFNFLQESTIDLLSASSVHLDPAVVAAQPMSRQPASRGDLYSSQSFEAVQDPASSQHTNITFGDQLYSTDQGLAQSFHSSALSQNFPTESWAAQVEDVAMGQFDISAALTIPQDSSDQSNTSNQTEKKFTMNAAAPEFQSMYSQSSSEQDSSTNADSSYKGDSLQQRKTRRDGSGGGSGNGGGGSGSGTTQRNRTGNNNLQNGYNQNSRGDNQNSRGDNQNSRGDNQTSRGGRGGYQGYSQQSNYNQADGYQGYSSGNNNFGQGYRQRGNGNQNQFRSGTRTNGGGPRTGGPQRGGGPAPKTGSPRSGDGSFERRAHPQ